MFRLSPQPDFAMPFLSRRKLSYPAFFKLQYPLCNNLYLILSFFQPPIILLLFQNVSDLFLQT